MATLIKREETTCVRDCLFLSVIVLLSVAFYTFRLGFYSDDWSFLQQFRTTPDQTILGLAHSVNSPQTAMRPVQLLYYAILYRVFGLHPVGDHIVNGVVFTAGIVLFYLSVREMRQPRLIALSLPLVYALLPHYSTDRLWFAANQATLSMTLYFLSLYADLRTVSASPAQAWAWKAVSLLGLLGSTLAYEVFLPLFLLNPVLVWVSRRQCAASGLSAPWPRGIAVAFYSANLLLLLPVMAFKTLSSTRLGNKSHLGEQLLWIVRQCVKPGYGAGDYGLNYVHAATIDFGTYGVGIPRVLGVCLRDYPNVWSDAIGVVVGLGIACYLYSVAKSEPASHFSRGGMLRLMLLGLFVFFLGYAIFFTNYNVQFSPTGIANRTALAAAIGVAMTFVGALGWLSASIPASAWQRSFFCVAVALLGAGGCIVINTIASFWESAYSREEGVITSIRQHLPTLPPGSTLILDGVCPYDGPAIVFESSWDLRGALVPLYHDDTLQADIVTPNLKVKAEGLETSLYETAHLYRYDKLIIFHVASGKVYPISSLQAAQQYFRTVHTDRNTRCPDAHEGCCVPIF